ncbi:MAG TPA: hypothetical protein VEH84_15515 [Alphaproteobacteria bacterium]|nr:hypothetical protein [Alphaproteobacteria bacterium]
MVRPALAAALALSGCVAAAPPPAPEPLALEPVPLAPETVAVTFATDPATGRTDGPFDPQTGLRVLTQTGEDGVLRVVIDPVSLTPVLLHEQRAPLPAPAPLAAPPAPAKNPPAKL